MAFPHKMPYIKYEINIKGNGGKVTSAQTHVHTNKI